MEKVDKNIYTDKEDLYNTINRVDPIEMYKALHPTIAEYIFFSSTLGRFIKIGNVSGHKTNLNKFIRNKIIQNIFYYCNGIKLKINNRNISEKSAIFENKLSLFADNMILYIKNPKDSTKNS